MTSTLETHVQREELGFSNSLFYYYDYFRISFVVEKNIHLDHLHSLQIMS